MPSLWRHGGPIGHWLEHVPAACAIAVLTTFLLAVATGLAMGAGGRDHALLAALVSRQGRRPDMLLTALACGLATVWLTCWTAALVAQVVPAQAGQRLAALALGLGAIDVLLARPVRVPTEPTHSLGALALVLLAWQITGASRLGLFAIVMLRSAPWGAGLGGAIASSVLGLSAWAAGPRWSSWRLDLFGQAIGLAALLIALLIGLS